MIKLDVLNLLEKNGKTKYWLYKQLGMSYQNFSMKILMHSAKFLTARRMSFSR